MSFRNLSQHWYCLRLNTCRNHTNLICLISFVITVSVFHPSLSAAGIKDIVPVILGETNGGSYLMPLISFDDSLGKPGFDSIDLSCAEAEVKLLYYEGLSLFPKTVWTRTLYVRVNGLDNDRWKINHKRACENSNQQNFFVDWPEDLGFIDYSDMSRLLSGDPPYYWYPSMRGYFPTYGLYFTASEAGNVSLSKSHPEWRYYLQCRFKFKSTGSWTGYTNSVTWARGALRRVHMNPIPTVISGISFTISGYTVNCPKGDPIYVRVNNERPDAAYDTTATIAADGSWQATISANDSTTYFPAGSERFVEAYYGITGGVLAYTTPQTVTADWPSPIISTSCPLTQGKITEEYYVSLSANGGKTPYTWTRDSGSLPPGLSLSPLGIISGNPSKAGTFNFTLRCTSDNNRFSTKDCSITILSITILDTTSPTVTITFPTSNTEYSTGSSMVDLSGTANDNVGVTQVSWCNLRGGSGTASGTGVWTIQGITLQLGDNYIVVTARDQAGNSDTDVIKIVCAPLEIVSAPTVPNGLINGLPGSECFFSSYGSSSSSCEYLVQYLFEWGDGSSSGWLSGNSASHSWNTPGTYEVRAYARCKNHTNILSGFSESISVNISYIALPTPVPCLPACGGNVNTTRPTLSWNRSIAADGYIVRIFSGSNCSDSPIYTSTQIALFRTNYSVPSSAGLQYGGTYSWQVMAKDNENTYYCDSPWSQCCSFNLKKA
jgi:hypothetical protein